MAHAMFEYYVAVRREDTDLNELQSMLSGLGKEGWELVSVIDVREDGADFSFSKHYFKRSFHTEDLPTGQGKSQDDYRRQLFPAGR